MSLRSLLNVAHAHLVEGMSVTDREEITMILNEKFEHEMTPAESARAKRKRKAIETGAYRAQPSLVGALTMPTKREHRR